MKSSVARAIGLSVAIAMLTFPAWHIRAAPRKEPIAAPTLSGDIQPILNDNCVACHQFGSPQKGLILEDGQAAAAVGRKSSESALAVIRAGDPANSYLVRKLEGTQAAAGGSGARMPLGGQLDASSIDRIKAWIKDGAKTN